MTLASLVRRYPRLVVLTGAGISAASGIPTYRDDSGCWQHSQPILHQDFIEQPTARQRYWARSMLGWSIVQQARPNSSHTALVQLEQAGHISLLVTQNVDRLHQRAGQRKVLDLHGRLDRVLCLHCQRSVTRNALQQTLLALNPAIDKAVADIRADGDAAIPEHLAAGFVVPGCGSCGGVLMPAVVFFGATVPRRQVAVVNQAIASADALLVAGSSLMVYSGFRFCRLAQQLGKPLMIVNRGKTRADDIATVKITADCALTLKHLATSLV
jgi:NAD-dependent SIR2 family protein deacetylase